MVLLNKTVLTPLLSPRGSLDFHDVLLSETYTQISWLSYFWYHVPAILAGKPETQLTKDEEREE